MTMVVIALNIVVILHIREVIATESVWEEMQIMLYIYKIYITRKIN